MAVKKTLSKRQLVVINDLFIGELDEQAVLEKYGVSRNVYNKWLIDEQFSAEFGRRIAGARLKSQALIARYSLMAAAKLVQLTDSESQETARKACLDIISLPKSADKKTAGAVKTKRSDEFEAMGESENLSPQRASRLLAALAEEECKNKK